ncbi:uncharacterized protein V2V93DRAFT_34851 [Kockiozyma suomiensis]|uniref:uncharacterized protein n=1 Tax=Kockiozyma suomiensis TaxID=1337062 RepID=UPI003344303C
MKRKGIYQHVILYWMVRESSSLKWVKDQLAELTGSGLIEINIYVTGEKVDDKRISLEEESSTSVSELSEKEAPALSAPPILGQA